MNTGKLTPQLAERIRHAGPGEVLDLVVELHPAGGEEAPGHASATTREERIARARAAFEADAAPVAGEICRAGGEIMAAAWVNQTLRARVPAASVARLAALDRVMALDLPRAMAAERA